MAPEVMVRLVETLLSERVDLALALSESLADPDRKRRSQLHRNRPRNSTDVWRSIVSVSEDRRFPGEEVRKKFSDKP